MIVLLSVAGASSVAAGISSGTAIAIASSDGAGASISVTVVDSSAHASDSAGATGALAATADVSTSSAGTRGSIPSAGAGIAAVCSTSDAGVTGGFLYHAFSAFQASYSACSFASNSCVMPMMYSQIDWPERTAPQAIAAVDAVNVVVDGTDGAIATACSRDRGICSIIVGNASFFNYKFIDSDGRHVVYHVKADFCGAGLAFGGMMAYSTFPNSSSKVRFILSSRSKSRMCGFNCTPWTSRR